MSWTVVARSYANRWLSSAKEGGLVGAVAEEEDTEGDGLRAGHAVGVIVGDGGGASSQVEALGLGGGGPAHGAHASRKPLPKDW